MIEYLINQIRLICLIFVRMDFINKRFPFAYSFHCSHIKNEQAQNGLVRLIELYNDYCAGTTFTISRVVSLTLDESWFPLTTVSPVSSTLQPEAATMFSKSQP